MPDSGSPSNSRALAIVGKLATATTSATAVAPVSLRMPAAVMQPNRDANRDRIYATAGRYEKS
jgi:hypothetical protein